MRYTPVDQHMSASVTTVATSLRWGVEASLSDTIITGKALECADRPWPRRLKTSAEYGQFCRRGISWFYELYDLEYPASSYNGVDHVDDASGEDIQHEIEGQFAH